MSDDLQNPSRNYVHEVIQPKKHQITAEALKYLQNFIHDAFYGKKEIDRSNIVLSPKEKEIFALLAKGLKTKETAKILNVRISTVQGYISRVYGKYGVKDRQKAIERYLKEDVCLYAEDEIRKGCEGCKLAEQNVKYYPPFTTDKQVKIIEWFISNRWWLNLKSLDKKLDFSLDFDEKLAKLVNRLWESFNDQEKEEIRRILNE